MSDLITSTSFLIRQLCPINHVNNYNRCIYIYTKCVDALERVYILEPNAISEGVIKCSLLSDKTRGRCSTLDVHQICG